MTNDTSGNPMEIRWHETFQMMSRNPAVVTHQFLDDFHRAMTALVNGNSEQVCLNRQNDQGAIQVQWSPVTVGERERRPGSGPG